MIVFIYKTLALFLTLLNVKACNCCCTSCKKNNTKKKNQLTKEQIEIVNKEIEKLEEENNRQKEYKDIKLEFNEPPCIGLQNVGATCYMNATLQCLLQIRPLTNYFKYDKHGTVKDLVKKFKEHGKLSLTSAFKIFVENMWKTKGCKLIERDKQGKNDTNEFYIPTYFKQRISDMNILFKGVQANDAKDLVDFIIMTLHEELNKAKKVNNTSNNNFCNINQTNEKLMLNLFFENFKNENMSIISDLFYGIQKTITQCLGCNETKYNFQAFFLLPFPLEKILEGISYRYANSEISKLSITNQMLYKQYFQNLYLNRYNQKIVTLDECFQYHENVNFFTGENMMYCNRCKKPQNANYRTTIESLPRYLIIVLVREKGKEFDIKLRFEKQMNLNNYVSENFKNINYGHSNYDLIGVVTHMGENGKSGHFVASCKSPIDNNWYCYNDEIVKKITDFDMEIVNYAMPYILIYELNNK